MKRIIRALIAAILLVAANASTNAAPPLSIIKQVKAQVESIRFELPMEIRPGMTLTQMSYDSQTYSIIYRYHFSVSVSKPTPTQLKEAKLNILNVLKAKPNSEEIQFLKSGITFHYNYYNPDGTFLYAVKITPADVR